jgi:hypothetical protein
MNGGMMGCGPWVAQGSRGTAGPSPPRPAGHQCCHELVTLALRVAVAQLVPRERWEGVQVGMQPGHRLLIGNIDIHRKAMPIVLDCASEKVASEQARHNPPQTDEIRTP